MEASEASGAASPLPPPPVVRPFFGQPFWWLVFGILLVAVPLVGYMARADMTWNQIHPALNAIFNGSSAVFLIAGYAAIRRRNIELHQRCMVAAFVMSSLFLASYLLRFYLSGTHRYPGDGADKIFYLALLFSHMVLAAVLVPMALRALHLAWRKRFADHRKIARYAWPVWIYVSITGVLVYLMLYPIAGALYGNG